MNPFSLTTITTDLLLAEVLTGPKLHPWLPEHHVNAGTRDSVNQATGLVATMSARLRGLLVRPGVE